MIDWFMAPKQHKKFRKISNFNMNSIPLKRINFPPISQQQITSEVIRKVFGTHKQTLTLLWCVEIACRTYKHDPNIQITHACNSITCLYLLQISHTKCILVAFARLTLFDSVCFVTVSISISPGYMVAAYRVPVSTNKNIDKCKRKTNKCAENRSRL